MAAFTFSQMLNGRDEDKAADDLAFELLELFEDGKPLREEKFMNWKLRHKISNEQIKKAAEAAISKGWILEDSAGLHLTHEGRYERDRV
jgi:hypothetical protein